MVCHTCGPTAVLCVSVIMPTLRRTVFAASPADPPWLQCAGRYASSGRKPLEQGPRNSDGSRTHSLKVCGWASSGYYRKSKVLSFCTSRIRGQHGGERGCLISTVIHLCIEPCGGEARRKLRRATRRNTEAREDGQILNRVFLNPDSVAPPLSKYLEKFRRRFGSESFETTYKSG